MKFRNIVAIITGILLLVSILTHMFITESAMVIILSQHQTEAYNIEHNITGTHNWIDWARFTNQAMVYYDWDYTALKLSGIGTIIYIILFGLSYDNKKKK